MNLAAIEHRAFDNYCYPLDRDKLEVNLRTGKDVRQVFLLWGDPFDKRKAADGRCRWHYEKLEASEKKELQEHFWWTAIVSPSAKRAKYFFKICGEEEAFIYGESGICAEKDFTAQEDACSPFIFPWMNQSDICTPPKWAESAVWYQIFPSRFCRGAMENEPQDILPWAGPDSPATNDMKFGGNLNGITQKLGYLADLGISGVYLTPVNQATTQHKYDTSDYYEIDPDFGTKEDLKRLVKEAHAHGIRVMLDGVFNHSGWNFFAWQDVLKKRQQSEYASWFMVNDWNFEGRPGRNTAEHKYFSFAFCDYMPKFNTNNPEVRDYLIKVCTYWATEYDIDALRLDVANEICHEFFRELQTAMRSLKSDFYIVGEIWHNAMPWLRGNECDAIMNYPLQNAIYRFMLDKGRPAKSFEQDVNRCLTDYFSQTQKVMFNLMDSHDTMRLATRLGSRAKALQTLAMLFCMPGSPCLYYGTEVFLPGGEDPDCRRCMPWKELEAGRYAEELALTKQLVHARKTYAAMRSPKMKFLHDGADGRVLILRKDSEEPKESIYLLANCGDRDFDAGSYMEEGTLIFASQLRGSLLLPDALALVLRPQ